jgi:uncharacterized protein YozE (UPF0346 family)
MSNSNTPNHQQAIDFILDKMKSQLPANLRYHSISHTLEVISSVKFLMQKQEVSEKEKKLLLTAAAYHDSGFTQTYKNHESIGCEIAQEALPQFDFNEEDIEKIQAMILATKIPQSPKNELEKIICDADLDYFGGENYYPIAQTLFDELKLNGNNLSGEDWLKMQIGFLEMHHYWTDYGQKVLAPKKAEILKELKAQREASQQLK